MEEKYPKAPPKTYKSFTDRDENGNRYIDRVEPYNLISVVFRDPKTQKEIRRVFWKTDSKAHKLSLDGRNIKDHWIPVRWKAYNEHSDCEEVAQEEKEDQRKKTIQKMSLKRRDW